MSNRWPPGRRDQDYYAIIGVPATASTEQITQAYHQLARTTHPDTDPEHADAADRFRLLADAHAVLADPVSRAAYDHTRSAISPGPRLADPTAGRRARRPRSPLAVTDLDPREPRRYTVQ
jgi:molecular chaperone DnaJ